MTAARRTAATLVAVLAAAGALPAAAGAVDIGADDGAVRYVAGPGEVNASAAEIVQGEGGPRLLIRDYSDIAVSGGQPAPLNVRSPCRLTGTARPQPSPGPGPGLPIAHAAHAIPDQIECPLRPALSISLGDLDDSFGAAPKLGLPVQADGGDGNDVVAGGDGGDTITGGPGRDLLLGGLGADRIDGGDDADTARYEDPDRATGVVVDLGGGSDQGSAQDGPAGARDTLAGIEGIDGSRFADRLTGGAGADQLDGGFGDDLLDGGAGDDAVTGGSGRDRLAGGRGKDALSARDGDADRVACDAGRDEVAVADAKDRVERSCETAAVGGVYATDPPIEIAGRARARGRALKVELGCTARQACAGTATVEAPGGRRLGRHRFRIPAGATREVRVRLRRRARKAVVVSTLTRDFAHRDTRTTRRVRLAAH